ncbi:MAG: HU family DNA-binding protein [Gammaproteobacteria bacterium]
MPRKTTRKTTSKAKKATRATKKPAKRTTAKKATTRRTTAKRATTAKRTATKSTVAKRTTAKRAAPKRVTTAIKTPLTKSQILSHIAENTELSKKQVSAIFEELGGLINRSIKSNSAGAFTIPGLMKIVSVRKPARKARKGINPFTGEETTFKAKPAHNVVKIRALKALKEMAK